MSEFPRPAHGSRLYRLEALDDVDVVDRGPDVRGWDLLAEDGARIGQAESLVVDLDSRRVRYLDVELDLQFSGDDNVRHVLVPIGAVRRDEARHRLVLSGTDRAAILNAPGYTGAPVDRDYELRLRETYVPGAAPGTDAADSLYDHDLYDVDRYHGRRG